MKTLIIKITNTLLLLHAVTLSTYAQKTVIDGEIRPRTEYRDGYMDPISTDASPGISTQQRTRICFNYQNELIQTYISLQDARVFGQESTSSSTGTVGIYEAWAEVLLTKGLRLKSGRQALLYDDTRLFSSPQWSNTGTSHDVAMLKYNRNNWEVHLASAYNNRSAIATETFYVPGAAYRMMNFLWIAKQFTKNFLFTAILVNEALQDTVDLGGIGNYKKTAMNHSFTYGGNIKYIHPGIPFSAYTTAYLQSGENFKGDQMNGFLMAIKLNYEFDKKYSVSIGSDYLSGDSNGTSDGIQGNFKKLYGADHTFNGYMDYWKKPAREGLIDHYATVIAKAKKNLKLETGFHLFFTDKNIIRNDIDYGKNLGTELNLLLTYQLNNITTIQGGYCKYFSINNTLLAKDLNLDTGFRSPHFAYVMISFRPTFLNSKLSKS